MPNWQLSKYNITSLEKKITTRCWAANSERGKIHFKLQRLWNRRIANIGKIVCVLLKMRWIPRMPPKKLW